MHLSRALLFMPLALVAASTVKQRDSAQDFGSAVGNGVADVTSFVSDAGDAATDGLKTVYEVVTDAAGDVKTVASKVITGVESGFDTATNAAASAMESHNGAASLNPKWSFSAPLTSSLAALLGGVAAGAWVAL